MISVVLLSVAVVLSNPSSKRKKVVFVVVVYVAIERVNQTKQNKKRKPTPFVASKVKYSTDYSTV